MKRLRVGFLSVVPSPYQRDLFAALALRPELEIRVHYMEKAAPDSPWPEKPLAPYESYLPGFWLPLGSRRVHLNWPLPRFTDCDVIVLNSLMSVTAQWLMRWTLRGRHWIFWGEKLALRGGLHRFLAAPLHRAAAIAGIGQWARADYEARFPEPRHYNIPYHCDLTAFLAQPRHEREGKSVTFLFCGQMIARKGLDLLLEAFGGLENRARLLLVGREAELPQMLHALPEAVRNRVEYTGFQAPETLPGYFAAADVFVLPSRHDGWGVVCNQALAAGLPIVCSDQVGAGFDLVEEGVNGCQFPAGDAGSLRTCLQRFLDEPARIDQYGSASRSRAAEWQPACGAARWLEALQNVAS